MNMNKHLKFFKDKKASMGYWQLIFAFIRISILSVALLSMAIMVYTFIDNATSIQGSEMDLFVEHLMYSQDGLSYYDAETARLYPGIIDYDDVSSPENMQKKLDKAFYYGSKPLMSAKFEWIIGEEIQNPEIKSLKEFYYNKQYYEEWGPLIGLTLKLNIQSATKQEHVLSVAIRKTESDGGLVTEKFYPAKIRITLISPNS